MLPKGVYPFAVGCGEFRQRGWGGVEERVGVVLGQGQALYDGTSGTGGMADCRNERSDGHPSPFIIFSMIFSLLHIALLKDCRLNRRRSVLFLGWWVGCFTWFFAFVSAVSYNI